MAREKSKGRTRAADLAAEDETRDGEGGDGGAADSAAEASTAEEGEGGESDEVPPTEPPPRAAAPPSPAELRLRGMRKDDRAGEYTQAGRAPQDEPVCLRSWSGVVDGTYRIVRRGVPCSKIPQVVIDEMVRKRGQFGLLKVETPPPPRGQVLVTNRGRGSIATP